MVTPPPNKPSLVLVTFISLITITHGVSVTSLQSAFTEEDKATGYAYSGVSSDIDFGMDLDSPNVEQVVAMSFPVLTLPAGASITAASIVFEVKASSFGSITVRMQAEANLTPSRVGESYFNATNRVLANSYVDWSPPDWNIDNGVPASARTTPDLSEIIQEFVSQPGWSSGDKTIVMLLDRSPLDTHTNTRMAYSGVSDSSKTPYLIITYDTTSGTDTNFENVD